MKTKTFYFKSRINGLFYATTATSKSAARKEARELGYLVGPALTELPSGTRVYDFWNGTSTTV